MLNLLLNCAAATLGLFFASRVLTGVQLRSFGDAVWAGVLLGALQWALTFPLSVALGIGTLGIGFLLWFLTRWIASALLILLASALSSRLEVRGFGTALVTAFLVAISGTLLRWFL